MTIWQFWTHLLISQLCIQEFKRWKKNGPTMYNMLMTSSSKYYMGDAQVLLHRWKHMNLWGYRILGWNKLLVWESLEGSLGYTYHSPSSYYPIYYYKLDETIPVSYTHFWRQTLLFTFHMSRTHAKSLTHSSRNVANHNKGQRGVMPTTESGS